jgi:prepilin-type N-terminal cleavage/methylation domain-containing protein
MPEPHAADTTAVRTRAVSRLLGRLRSDEGGFSLIELLVTILILGLVLGATLSMLSTTNALVPADIQAGHTLEDAQTGINRMTRELRQGSNLQIYNGGTAATAGDRIFADFGTKRVLYQCDLAQSAALNLCRRIEGTTTTSPSPGGTGPTLVPAIQNAGSTVFNQPGGAGTKYFQLFIKVKSNSDVKINSSSSVGGHQVTFRDGFYARNG